ncbi:hypothetical protein [Paraburkholderia sp. BR14374]|uniref:hypothetical protein n=1 Tax=Paraburkholderia sp. BR14374 TaxID=3237007 RepID=UPI0034D0044B
MKKPFLGFLFAIILAFSTTVRAEGMCGENESVIFNCELHSSTASLCEAKDAKVLTYRYGKEEKIELEISDAGFKRGNIFHFSDVPYSGGGEAHIRFSRGGYTYYLYDKTVKTESGPQFSAGIVIYRGIRRIGDRICVNDASIRQSAYSEIEREEYRDIRSK